MADKKTPSIAVDKPLLCLFLLIPFCQPSVREGNPTLHIFTYIAFLLPNLLTPFC